MMHCELILELLGYTLYTVCVYMMYLSLADTALSLTLILRKVTTAKISLQIVPMSFDSILPFQPYGSFSLLIGEETLGCFIT